jgi:MAGE homology domain
VCFFGVGYCAAESSSSGSEGGSDSDSEQQDRRKRAAGNGRKKAAGKKRKKADTGSSSDEAPAEEGDASQASQGKGKKEKPLSKRQKILNSLRDDPAKRDHLVAAIVRFVVFKDSKKEPVKKAEISAGPLAEFKGTHGVLQELLSDVQEKFQQIFGMELYTAGPDNAEFYMLRSSLPDRLRQVCFFSFCFRCGGGLSGRSRLRVFIVNCCAFLYSWYNLAHPRVAI